MVGNAPLLSCLLRLWHEMKSATRILLREGLENRIFFYVKFKTVKT